MAYTFDISNDIGKIRALVRDTATSGGANTAIFTDEEITAFKNLVSGNLLMAAAVALRAKAEAIPAIAWETGDLRVDKRSIAKERRLLADKYEKMAKSTPVEYIDTVVYRITKFGEDVSHYINDTD